MSNLKKAINLYKTIMKLKLGKIMKKTISILILINSLNFSYSEDFYNQNHQENQENIQNFLDYEDCASLIVFLISQTCSLQAHQDVKELKADVKEIKEKLGRLNRLLEEKQCDSVPKSEWYRLNGVNCSGCIPFLVHNYDYSWGRGFKVASRRHICVE